MERGVNAEADWVTDPLGS